MVGYCLGDMRGGGNLQSTHQRHPKITYFSLQLQRTSIVAKFKIFVVRKDFQQVPANVMYMICIHLGINAGEHGKVG